MKKNKINKKMLKLIKNKKKNIKKIVIIICNSIEKNS